MEGGSLKESQDRHSGGPGEARKQSSLEMEGCEAEAPAARVPVRAALNLLLVTNPSQDLVADNSNVIYFS